LPARKLCRVLIGKAKQADPIKELQSLAPPLRPRSWQGKGDVLPDAQVRKQGVALGKIAQGTLLYGEIAPRLYLPG
jgi:hypothetical protein